MCNEEITIEVEMPAGWRTQYGIISPPDSDVFCPKHAVLKSFLSNQCPGCVSGWGECGLWDGITHHKGLSELELCAIKHGRCPKRTNGTSEYDARTGVFDQIDFSKPSEVGPVVETMIREYRAKWYPKPEVPE